MKLRAIVFDIYKTVLDVGPAPADRDARWSALGRETFNVSPPGTLASFSAACDQIIAREHAAARGVGIPFPEIFWPDIVAEVLPESRALPAAAREEFLFRQQGLFRTVRLMPGAAEVLRALPARGVRIGIASNAQPYTLRELEHALAEDGLTPALFNPDLCFWSFAHGFSKPDPHVFRLLTARLRAHGVQPDATLMVGDRHDNDIAPARAQGWRTWQLRDSDGDTAGGGWSQLGEFIASQT